MNTTNAKANDTLVKAATKSIDPDRVYQAIKHFIVDGKGRSLQACQASRSGLYYMARRSGEHGMICYIVHNPHKVTAGDILEVTAAILTGTRPVDRDGNKLDRRGRT